jgi:hypothetical protein
MKSTVLLNLVPRLRTNGATPLLPYIPSWHGQGKLTFHDDEIPQSKVIYYNR